MNVVSDEKVTDGFHHTIPPGRTYHVGRFLERAQEGKDCTTFKVRKDEKRTYFYRVSVLCPFVEKKKGFVLSNSCYVDVLYHVESNGFQHI